MLVTFAFIPWYMKPVAKAETTIFSDGFESGTFLPTDVPPGAWTSIAVGGGVDSATITTDSPHHGSYNAKLIAASASWSCVKKSFTGIATAFVRAYYTFSTLPTTGEKVYLTELRTNNGGVGIVLENVSGNLFWILNVDEGGTTYTTYEAAPSNPTTGVPYSVELKRDVTNGFEQLWVNSVSKATDDVSATNNSTEIVIGYGYNTEVNEQTCYVDCVVIADAYIGPETADSIPPTFANISTNTTKAGQSCSFNCLVNDDTNVSTHIFSTNNTGAWANDTVTVFSHFFNATAAWTNVTKTLNGTVGNLVCYMWYANDTSNNWSKSGQFNLTLVRMSYYLVVSSPYGAPTPASGWFDEGSSVTSSVTSPWPGSVGTRYVCIGWTGTGSVPSSGTGTTVTFTVTAPSSISWNWKTQYLLTVKTDPENLDPQPARDPTGDPESSNTWWYDTTPDVTLTAQTVAGYTFNYWTVDNDSRGNGVNPIAVALQGSHIAIAYYSLTDITPPEITVISPQNETYYSSMVPLEFTVNEATSWIGYSLDGQANVTIGGNTTLTAGDGSHLVVVYANDTSGNVGSSSIVHFTARTGVIDIGVIFVRLSKDVVCEGYSMLVDVTVKNEGDYVESFNVTLYANNTKISSQPATLNPGKNTTLMFAWGTTGFSIYGRYNITATLDPMPGELDISDNTLSGGAVIIAHLGDINGDGKVDVQDLARVSAGFGSVRINDRNDPKYWQYWHPIPDSTCPHTPNADINNDGKIELQDLARTSASFGWHRT
jgi:hypothetical protein